MGKGLLIKRDVTKLESMLKLAKMPKAKGALIYKVAKDRYDKREKHPDEGVRSPTPPIDFPIKPIPLLQSEKEGVLQAAALAFKDEEFKLGYTLALQGEVLETIITQLEQVPTEDLEISGVGDEKIPESITNLPGFHRHRTLTSPDFEAMKWARGLFYHLIDKVLEPMKEFYRAAKLRIQLGRGNDAIFDACYGYELKPEEVAELCELAQAGFDHAIGYAKDKDRNEIVLRLQEKHIQSLVNGTHAEHGKKPERWNMARELAKHYGHVQAEVKEVSTTGIADLFSEFENELGEWREKLFEAEQGRDYQQESRIRDARTHYIDRLSHNAAELVKLIKKLPEKEQPVARRRLYHICARNRASHDAFGIAIAFEDYDHASEIGSGLSTRSDFGSNRDTGSAMQIMESQVLEHVGEKRRKDYLRALMSHESWDGGYEHSFNVAKKHGLAEWLMEKYEKNKRLKAAANIAKKLDNNQKAKEIFVQAKLYADAIKCTDSPVEQASLCFRIVEEIVAGRIERPSIHRGDNEFNYEVVLIQKAMELAKGLEHTLGYIAAANKVTENLFACGNYAEACLFIEETGIPREQFTSLIPPDALETAESKEDFASCYHLARLQDRPEEAEGYQLLAKELEREIPTALGDLIHEDEYLKKTRMRIDSLFVELTPAQRLELDF